MTPTESQMLGEIHANVATLIKNDSDKEQRLKCLESKHSTLKGVVIATNAIVGAVWATFVLTFPSVVKWINEK